MMPGPPGAPAPVRRVRVLFIGLMVYLFNGLSRPEKG
jgi:hypothetical protein